MMPKKDIRRQLRIPNDDAMLEVAIAGKKSVVKEYWQVLKEIDLPSCTSLLLHQQMGIIEKDLAEIKTLDDIS